MMGAITSRFEENSSIRDVAAPQAEPLSHSRVMLSLIMSLVVSFLG